MIKLKETERNFKTIDSMYEMVQGWSTRRDKIAFRYFTAPGEIASLTYGEFEEIVSRLAAAYPFPVGRRAEHGMRLAMGLFE